MLVQRGMEQGILPSGCGQPGAGPLDSSPPPPADSEHKQQLS